MGKPIERTFARHLVLKYTPYPCKNGALGFAILAFMGNRNIFFLTGSYILVELPFFCACFTGHIHTGLPTMVWRFYRA